MRPPSSRSDLTWTHTWLSPELTLQGITPGALVLTTIEGCDEAMSFLAAGAEVFAVSEHEDQRALLHLILAAVQDLPVQSVRALLGMDAPGRRVWFYHHVRGRLPVAERGWWDAREALVRTGIWASGSIERQLRQAAPLLLREGTVGRAARTIWARRGDAWRQALLARWVDVRPALAPLLKGTQPKPWPWLTTEGILACRNGRIHVVERPPLGVHFHHAHAGSSEVAARLFRMFAPRVRVWSDHPQGVRDPLAPFTPWMTDLHGQGAA